MEGQMPVKQFLKGTEGTKTAQNCNTRIDKKGNHLACQRDEETAISITLKHIN